jgi:hypothetical protein
MATASSETRKKCVQVVRLFNPLLENPGQQVVMEQSEPTN